MFHNAEARRRHKPISSTSTYLFFNKNYSSKLRVRERREKIERKRFDALDVAQFTRELMVLIDTNNFEGLEEKIRFFNNILPQEITSIDTIKTLNICLDLGNSQIKILTLKCLAKIAAVNQDLIDDKHYIQLFSSDCIEILKLLLELYTYVSKKHLNESNLKNLIKISECLGGNDLDFFKNLANFTSSALTDPYAESLTQFIVKSKAEIYRILESLPQNIHPCGDNCETNTICDVDCVTDMLYSIHLCCDNLERKIGMALKFINLASVNQDILLPAYLIICQTIHQDSHYQLNEELFTMLETSLKSQKRRVKLASLVLATTMAGKNNYTAKFVLPLSNTIIDILESKESYDIRLESAIYVMHMMFGHGSEFINNFIKIEPRISAAMLDLLDSCKQDYTTAWLCLDYLEWCLSKEESVRRLYDLRAIEIIESVQFLHSEEVDRRVCELIKPFDVIDI
ncbi:hypothetical protein BMR1_03g00180 [Babesia microti strain RI]|uniref:Uncharacterized protein n=1 Tax=Babesia microti (strain RI) TaxID=1133968 RepID=A0A1R4AB38_BABMR|nr:hypothetical protein BMR1_03g00180 [Babesia microti strain RI]SJK86207.1 hypothetical protein BMR1_03g00180 [Babesia microti strain RI]|eukprot:XP_021338395.1 hypothetical protein BMR1_03g00180 [Babesia microti strain RI]